MKTKIDNNKKKKQQRLQVLILDHGKCEFDINYEIT